MPRCVVDCTIVQDRVLLLDSIDKMICGLVSTFPLRLLWSGASQT
jgi:hypothetical protein